MHPHDDEAASSETELTVIEGGKSREKHAEHADARARAKNAGGLMITTSHRHQSGIGLAWPQVLGVIPYGTDTLAIVGSFCLVTLHGSGVADLARPILDRRLSELREGGEFHGGRIDRITIEGNLPKLGNQT
jgi:hypothetical protein